MRRTKLLVAIIAGVLMCAGLVLALAPGSLAYPGGWTSEIKLADAVADGEAREVDIESNGSQIVAVVWRDVSNHIWARISEDQGLTWLEPQQISPDDSFDSYNPCVAVVWDGADPTKVVAAWIDKWPTSGGTGQLVMRIYDSDTRTWRPWGESYYTNVNGIHFGQPSISCSGSGSFDISCYYNGEAPPNTYKVQARRFWVTELPNPRYTINVVDTGGPWRFTDVVHISEMRTIVAYEHETDGKIYTNVTTDSGWHYGGQQIIGLSGYDLSHPRLEYYNDIACVVFDARDGSGHHFVYRALMEYAGTGGALTWSPPTLIASNGYTATYPHVASCNRYSLSTIIYNGENNQDVRYCTGGDNGLVRFSRPVRPGHLSAAAHQEMDWGVWEPHNVMVDTDGNLWYKRTDADPPTGEVLKPLGVEDEDLYKGSDFDVEISATDNWNHNGTDPDGKTFFGGVEEVEFEYSENESNWYTVPVVSGTARAETPPWRVRVKASSLNGKKVIIRATIKDSADNYSYIYTNPIVVDTSNPGTTHKVISGVPGENGWWRSTIVVKLYPSDYILDTTWFKVDSGPYQLYEGPFVLTEGEHTVRYYSEDRCGNTESAKTATFNIDDTPPDVAVNHPKKDSIQTGFIGEELHLVGGEVSDGNAPAWIGIFINDDKVAESTEIMKLGYSWATKEVPEGVYTIKIVGKDIAGNTATAEKNIYLGNFCDEWYLAEGTTRGNFDEYICIMNPDDANGANANFEFMLETGEVIPYATGLSPSSRTTVNVRDVVGPEHDVATKITSDAPIIVERPMYFNYGGMWDGGHDGMGTNVLQKQWYFAEGTTRDWSDLFLTFFNPHDRAVTCDITYMLEHANNVRQSIAIAPHTRNTVKVDDIIGDGQDVSTLVESSLPITVERPMYFTYQGFLPGGHNVTGIPSPSREWYFAEGATYEWMYPWLCIQNPNNQEANLTITYMNSLSDVTVQEWTIAPEKRKTINVVEEVGVNQDVSVKIESDLPIVAERPIYYNYHEEWEGGDDCMGATSLSYKFFLAEGTSREGFETWLTILNPDDDKSMFRVYYMFPDGTQEMKEYEIGAYTRKTVNVNTDTARSEDVSIYVDCLSPMAVERPMYFNYGTGWEGGHVIGGYGVD